LQICGQRAQAPSESVNTAARQAKRSTIRHREFVGGKGCTHQTDSVVIGSGEQHVTDLVSEHATERTRQLMIGYDPCRRPPVGSKRQHTLGRFD
jgi:hypothetical protein